MGGPVDDQRATAGHRAELPPRELAQLRLRAEERLRAGRHQELLGLVPELRGDTEWWAHLWAPGAALAAARLGSPSDALALLEEAIAGGFSQPELFDGELEKVFATEWPALGGRVLGNVPLPSLELTDWPDAPPMLPLELYTIAPDRLSGLLERLPSAGTSAWATALGLLQWVHKSWQHANDHVNDPDALTVLERVDAGERFACVEYSVVLSQALNAVRIPARRVDLRQPAHHTGVGRGHVVSEAWIDELDRWVVLDGQNGSYWADDTGQPLGVQELQALDSPPRCIGSLSQSQAAEWFRYFASATTTGVTWAAGSFAPLFQGARVIQTPHLARQSNYPQLSALRTGLDGTVTRPVVRFEHFHPYGVGIRLHLSDRAVDADEWALDLTPGRHELAVAVVTPYGQTAPQRFSYVVRSSA
ncbi:transglutaminase domain-containing protein [Kribbella italica]|uniref:Transglutaminase superfamily protein n=1 Tax=Kribbella italica TaxID=1540520 RepID=A0A7W9JCZ5_9ACTN|nr:transglutaminase domain-containing protein [Kribbella italica]MBB5839173.1 hypothetical protein [Kribbella italica]